MVLGRAKGHSDNDIKDVESAIKGGGHSQSKIDSAWSTVTANKNEKHSQDTFS